MVIRIAILAFLIAAFVLPSNSSAQPRKEGQRFYRYTDEQGTIYVSQTVPPEHAHLDREVLNQHGVRIGFEQGEVTAEERAEQERLEAEEAAALEARMAIARYERMLLQTYITVADIEELRDRRLERVESQNRVTEAYLNNQRKRLVALQADASAFKPYTTQPDAPQIPESLALDMKRTLDLVNRYEGTLARTRDDQEALRSSFDRDIVRFRQLKGL